MLTCRDSPAWLVVVRTVQQQLVCHVVLDVDRVVSDVCRMCVAWCRMCVGCVSRGIRCVLHAARCVSDWDGVCLVWCEVCLVRHGVCHFCPYLSCLAASRMGLVIAETETEGRRGGDEILQ